jgi:beta-glucosidase
VIYDPPSPLAAIRTQAPDADVQFDDGTDIARAVAAAKDADVAIVFGQQWMREGRDVPNLSLPGKQDALIDAVAGANPRTVVVLETGGPVVMPWLSKASAVLEAWYPGQGGAEAIARILFGAANPSGHLAVTFPMREDQLPRPAPPYTIQSHADVAYTEGANVGYRWFEAQNLTPLFPFGYGLSYTTFRFSKLVVQAGASPTASFDITNTGTRAGEAVAQVYAEPPQGLAREVRRLIGWSKVELAPDETSHVKVTADPRLLAHYDVATRTWHVAAGNYLISLCGSSADAASYAWVHLDERTMKP